MNAVFIVTRTRIRSLSLHSTTRLEDISLFAIVNAENQTKQKTKIDKIRRTNECSEERDGSYRMSWVNVLLLASTVSRNAEPVAVRDEISQ